MANIFKLILFLLLLNFVAFAEDIQPNRDLMEMHEKAYNPLSMSQAIREGNYSKIYDLQEEADFEYIFGIDPYQTDEYTKYMYSPYPLFRTGVTLIFKSSVIPPGYYLLTPREKNGKTYILFKEHGKVKYMVSPYKIQSVSEEFYKTKFPQRKLTFTQKVRKNTMDFIGTKWGKQNQRTPIPQTYIDFNDVGEYWDMILYYGNKKYYILFKKD